MKKILLLSCIMVVLNLAVVCLTNAVEIRYSDSTIVDDATTLSKGGCKLGLRVIQTADPGLYTNSAWLRFWYGLTDQFEVSIASEVSDSIYGSDRTNKHDYSDITLQGKYQFLNNDNLSLAAKINVKIAPNNSAYAKGLSTGEEDYKFELAGTKFFGRAKVNANLGYNFIGDPPGTDYADELSYSLAVMYPVKKVILAVDLVGKTDKTKGGGGITFNQNILDLWGGVRWKFSLDPDIRVKLGIGTRLSEAAPDYLGTLAIAYYF
ncbi:MAG: transporter [Candidatus Omnitrophota bacterium]